MTDKNNPVDIFIQKLRNKSNLNSVNLNKSNLTESKKESIAKSKVNLSWDDGRSPFKNKIFPSSCRILIVAKTNSGKTYLMRKLILLGYLDYNNLVFFTTTLDQIEYRIIIYAFQKGLNKEHIVKIFEKQKDIKDPFKTIDFISDKLPEEEKNKVICNAFDDDRLIPEPKDFDKKLKNLIVFDDSSYGDQSNLHKYFFRGRHNNINSIYITQNYFQLPRKSIRANSECLILFKIPRKDLQHIFTDHCSGDFKNFEEFVDLCNQAWETDHGYIYIDVTQNKKDKKYRINCFD